MSTVRVRLDDPSGVFGSDRQSPVIYCLWHNRLAQLLVFRQRCYGCNPPTTKLAALTSASRDGGLLAAVLAQFRVHAIRGSTSRRGPQALLELARWSRSGGDIALTPDGPRGPKYQLKDGILSLAQVAGCPIVPVTTVLTRKFILKKSWDHFEIPLPFGRCDITVHPPVPVPKRLSDPDRAQLLAQLQQTMLPATE